MFFDVLIYLHYKKLKFNVQLLHSENIYFSAKQVT